MARKAARRAGPRGGEGPAPLSASRPVLVVSPESSRAGEIVGALQGKLTAQVVEVVQEAQRPVVESIGQEVAKRVDGISGEAARSVAEAIVARAGELCFPNWYAQPYMDTELYRELTIVLVDRFKDLNLHGQGKDFVDRCIRLLKKVRFVGEAQA